MDPALCALLAVLTLIFGMATVAYWIAGRRAGPLPDEDPDPTPWRREDHWWP